MNAIVTTLENAYVITRKSKAGNELGQRIHFVGSLPASDIKKALQKADPKLKGAALKAKVHDVLTGKSDIAWMTFDALASAARSQGFIPDYTDQNKAADRMTARFIKPTAPKAEKAKAAVPAAPSKEEVEAAAVKLIAERMGISVEEALNVLNK